MNKDLIIGGASNYSWNELKYWVNSIRKSGFEGDVALVGTNYTKDTIDKLTNEGVILSLFGTQQPNGDITAPSKNAPHVERFFYLWNFLNTTSEDYGRVIVTDTRDVIFQKNPSDWLDENLVLHSIVASGEGMLYKDEPWNNQNILESFGPFFHNLLKENQIYNVGVIGGDTEFVKGLLSFIFHLSVNRPIPIVDQAVYNFIMNTPPFSRDTMFTDNDGDWSVQLATTIEAVKSGAGDIGQVFMDSPDAYERLYMNGQPLFENGVVKNQKGEVYTIVHQYDRVPELKTKIEQLYGDAE